MKAIFRIALATLAAHGLVAADSPKKAPITKYTNLWQNSPFTSKPPPPGPVEEAPAFEDYSLAGVSPIEGGYRVTLMDKKKPEQRIFIYSDDPNPKHGFKILGVTRKPDEPRGTVVRLSSGSQTGTVTYDDKLMAIAAPKPQAPQQPQAIPGQPMPQPLQPGQMPQRQPRPRVVPPPVPTQGQVQPGQPQIQPQIQPQVPITQPQVVPQQSQSQRFERPDRRGGR
jgi:hypothetical protein